MSGKNHTNSNPLVRRNTAVPKIPKKTQDKVINQAKIFEQSTSRAKPTANTSLKPLRMSIKLEDIIKASKSKRNISNLKPELIEPELEASIPSFQYIPKSSHAELSLKSISPIEKIANYSTIKLNANTVDFSFDKLDADCLEIEENIIFEKNKAVLDEMQAFIQNKFNCKVKLIREKVNKKYPTCAIIKSNDEIRLFSVSKL